MIYYTEKTIKMFMQNLKHKRVHILLSILTHDILQHFYKPSFKRSCGSFRCFSCISGVFFVQNSFNFLINYCSSAPAIFVIFNFVDLACAVVYT